MSLAEARSEDFRARVFHPEDIERLRESRRIAFVAGVPFENEQRVLGGNGAYRWFLIHHNPFRDESGNSVRWYATGTDIDDRKLAQERMRSENVALREEILRSSLFEEIAPACRTVDADVHCRKSMQTPKTQPLVNASSKGSEMGRPRRSG